MSRDNTLNINEASREDPLNLAGITERQVDRIIAERPFDDAHDLIIRRAKSRREIRQDPRPRYRRSLSKCGADTAFDGFTLHYL